MRVYDIIEKKRNKKALTKEEIEFVITGLVDGSIPDYQVSSLIMAIYLNGMNDKEVTYLTDAMAHSGDMMNLEELFGNTIDKHSTGGVGDKTSLIICPIVASLGCKVAKMSGKGLGFTGGTIDKLDSIPHFKTSISKDEFIRQVNDINISIISQTGNIAPADKKIYAIRDITATVSSIPLIASSIMSKKIAAGDKNILLDVKVGSGAFMKTKKDATELATKMVNIGKNLGKNMMAIITNMDEPLGNNIGNSLEVIEAIEILKGKGNKDLRELCIILASNMVMLSKDISYDEANKMVIDSIKSGKALDKFREFVHYQYGDPNIINNYDLLPKSKYSYEVIATKSGYITKINSEEIGKIANILGAGRNTMDDKIDYGAGIIMHKKLNDRVKKGEVIATLYSSKKDLTDAFDKYGSSIVIGKTKIKKPKLVLGYIK
ncbi:MAG: pyrimidine-nucleoside phosphorylase [Bacilli bacterium]|nr:pyrimidine-nucleoside phosphorylase [Bacilli bacterium]